MVSFNLAVFIIIRVRVYIVLYTSFVFPSWMVRCMKYEMAWCHTAGERRRFCHSESRCMYQPLPPFFELLEGGSRKYQFCGNAKAKVDDSGFLGNVLFCNPHYFMVICKSKVLAYTVQITSHVNSFSWTIPREHNFPFLSYAHRWCVLY